MNIKSRRFIRSNLFFIRANLGEVRDGASVKLKGIGTFGVWVTIEGFDNSKDINPKKVKAIKVTYKADRKLTQAIRGMKFDNMPRLTKGLVTKLKKI